MKSQKIEKSTHPLSAARRGKSPSRNLGAGLSQGGSTISCFLFLRNSVLTFLMLVLTFSFFACQFNTDSKDSGNFLPAQVPSTTDSNNSNSGSGQTNGGSTASTTPNESSQTNVVNGVETDSENGRTYYTTITTTTKSNQKVNEKSSSLASEDEFGVFIASDGTATLKNDAAKAVSASLKTTLYKDETTKTKKYYTDKAYTVPATGKPDELLEKNTVYHAEAVLAGSTLKTTIKSANYTASKTVDVKQYFDAKTELEANLPTAGSVVDFSARVAEKAIADARSLLPSGATLDDDKITIPESKINVPSGYEYDYQNDIANAHFNVKMSDVRGTNTKFDGSIVKTSASNTPLIYGVSSYVYNDDGDDMRAIKFADSVKSVNIDLENKNTNLVYMYAGGVIANNASVSLSNANGATLYGSFSTDGAEGKNALKDSALMKALKTSSELPTFTSIFTAYMSGDKNGNLYGTDIDKVIENYYSKNAKSKMNPEFNSVYFNAKSYLNGESMFDETGYKGKAYHLNANAAALMLNGGVNVSNVEINETNSTGKTKFIGEMTNIYTTTDWSSITSSGYGYGMMYFVSKPPSTNIGNRTTKVVVKAYNERTTYGAHTLDISALSDNAQKSINLDAIDGTVYFKDGINRDKPNTTGAYIFGSKYKGRLEHTYTNASWETIGERKNSVYGEPISQTGYQKISRLDGIKLSPIDKLLLDDQHIYG